MQIEQTISPSNIELEQTNDQDSKAHKEKKRTRFRSPIRHIFKTKKNDGDDDDADDDKKTPPYFRLKEEKQYSDLQFQETTPPKVPVYAIALAIILFLVGSVMITLGALMLTGYIDTQYKDRTWPLILIGSLVFLPGFYHLRIAYWAWKGDKSFSFADIPDLDWF